ncbi:MAG: ATP-binding protein [Chlorobiaceae bacterium]|nr:ATP-binding protein [Chlorobiaceae bacterium]
MNTTIILPSEMCYLRLATVAAWTAAEIFSNSLNAENGIHDFCHAFKLAVCETFSNSVRYSVQSNEEKYVTIRFSSSNDRLTALVSDSNPPFDPAIKLPDIESFPEGGFGLFLVRQLMDEVVFTRENGMNLVTMTKKLMVQDKQGS